MNDPVFYHGGGKIHDDPSSAVEKAGWYFWTETWADYCGPYETREKVDQELTRYCKEYL